MSRNKRKGTKYENEFASLVQDFGLPARRVPLSGAVAEYPGDVEVCDEVLVECKYRGSTDTGGMKTLYRWMDSKRSYSSTGLRVEGSDFALLVYTFEGWCEHMRARVDHEPQIEAWDVVKSASGWLKIRDWVGDCQYLALRMPHCAWLVVEVFEK